MAGETQRKTDAAQQGCAENEYEPVSSIYTSELKSDDIVTDEFINGPGDNKSSSSEASEIARIADVSISDDVASCKDGPSLDERMKQGTLRIIEATMATTSTSIDLSKRKLQAIPDELSSLPYLEYIYLEGNEITHLPEDFFKMFPCLRWLDLRNNALSKIPSTHLSFHTCLRNLLLEGNNLHSLPLELGLMKSLHGLNIAGNPLAFPPQEIIERGTQCILAYLRDMFSKNCTDFAGLELDLSKDALERYENKSASSDDWNTVASMMDLAKKREMILEKKSKLNMNYGSEQVSGTKNIKQRSASCQMIEKLKKTGSVGKDDRKKKKESKLTWKINPYPSLPSQDYIMYRTNEEKRLAKVKELNEKTEALIQKQKNNVTLKNWRDDAKVLQQKKYAQRLLPGRDYTEPAEQAPFGTDKEMMKVLSKEDRLKRDLQKEAELKLKRALLPSTKLRLEQEKQIRIHELEQRIKEHTAAMVERRKQPKGTPQQEIELARRELDIAEQLHGELLAQRRGAEYCL